MDADVAELVGGWTEMPPKTMGPEGGLGTCDGPEDTGLPAEMGGPERDIDGNISSTTAGGVATGPPKRGAFER